MVWISLTNRRPVLRLLYSCVSLLLLIETVSSSWDDGVHHMKLNNNYNGHRPIVEGDRISSSSNSNNIPLSSSSSSSSSHHHHARNVDESLASTTTSSSNSNNLRGKETGCNESWCSSFNEHQLLELDAIRQLHRQIDDDQNGAIDVDESDEFLREELAYEGDYEKRQRLFHKNDDNHISVRELWQFWISSEVHNWTTGQTIDWLRNSVGLPQYESVFIQRNINGTFLPRLAINQYQVLSSMVGIKDPIAKQKLALKAQDVVLFGYTDYGNRTKDSILTTLLVLALTVCWFVYSRYKLSQRDLNKMIKDMESLAKAEQCLIDLQKELEKARHDKLEKAEEEAGFLRKSLDDSIPCSEEITRLKGEVEVLRNELQRAEVELQDKCWMPPPQLQHWLQLTYELELKSYNRKKQGAEKQLKQAKEACDKLKKKRSSLMGAFVSTHGRSIDDVDKAILEARTSLTEITHELQERMHRWKQIEALVNCPIMNNPGLPYLETILRGIGRGSTYNGPGSVISNSQDDIDDDGASSIYAPSAVSKLIATSLPYVMYPANESPFRILPMHNEETGVEVNSRKMSITHASNCSSTFHSKSSSVDPTVQDVTAVSAPGGSSHPVMHAPISRSKSVSSMISLRERAMSRDCSSKENSSTGEEEVSTETEVNNGRDRRVTFGIQTSRITDHRELISTTSITSQQQPRWKKEESEEGKEEPHLIKMENTVVVETPKTPNVKNITIDEKTNSTNGKENMKIWKLISSLKTSKSLRPKFGLDNHRNNHHSAVTIIPDHEVTNNKSLSWKTRQVLRLRPSWKISHATKQ